MIKSTSGFVGNLYQPSIKYLKKTKNVPIYAIKSEIRFLSSIADMFLLHDKVVFNADVQNINALLCCFSTEELEEMLNNNRIAFCLPNYSRKKSSYSKSIKDYPDYSDFLGTHLQFADTYFGGPRKNKWVNGNKITKIVYDNLTHSDKLNQSFTNFTEEMSNIFFKDLPRDTLGDSIIAGEVTYSFNMAMDMIQDLWDSGIGTMSFHDEILHFFKICTYEAFNKNIDSENLEYKIGYENLIDELHSFKNAPSLLDIIYESENPTKTMIDC